jgi:serine/threonine protein kinase
MAAAVSHPPDPLLAAFGLGTLDEPMADEVARHLESCPDCRRRVAELPADDFVVRMRAAVGGQETPQPSESIADRPAGPPPELAACAEYAEMRELGRGGMGVVYLARNTLMDRLEVLKVVNRSADRFTREIKAASRLKHPNVVGAYSARPIGGVLVFAMEYVPGEDLAQLVKNRGPLPVAHACHYAYQAAQGLQHAHEQGMVHRDIKPSNLILTRDGNKPVVKILDFGLAKGTSETGIDGSQTAEGAMLGTPDYVAPEQTLDAAKADIRADIYSLGCTLYHLLAGRPPFVGRSLYEILRAHHSNEAVRLSILRPEVPDELAGLVAKMMAKDPARRFSTPKAAGEALVPFFKQGAKPAATSLSIAQGGRPPMMGKLERSSKPSAVPPPLPASAVTPRPNVVEPVLSRPQPRRWRRWAVGLIAAALLATLAGGLVVKMRNGTIVFEGLPTDAEVLVDNETVTVKRDGDVATVRVAKGGPYGLKVKLGDRELSTSEATVTIGGEPVTIKVKDYQPTPEPTKIPAGDGASPIVVDRKPAFVRGEWRRRGNVIEQTARHAPDLLLFGSPDFGDGDFTCDIMRGEKVQSVSLVFRAADREHYYYFEPGWHGGNWTSIWTTENGDKSWRCIAQKETESLPANQWIPLRIELRGEEIKAFVDGKPVFSSKDSVRTSGYIGLRTWGCPAQFRNTRFTDPSGKVLWEGLPELAEADKPFEAKIPGPGAKGPILDRTARTNGAGNWQIKGNELVQTDATADNCALVFGDPNWTDYDFTFDAVKTEGPFGIAALFRADGLKKYMVFDLAGWQNRKLTIEYDVDGKFGAWIKLDKLGSMAKDRTYKVEVRVRGDHYVCSVDDNVIYDVHDGRLPHGAVGLRCWGGAVRVGSILVKSPDGKVLWEGPPELAKGVGAAEPKKPEPPKIDPAIRAAFTNRGDWSIDGNELVQSNDKEGDCEIAFGDPAWTDYNFVCEAKVVAGFGGEISQTFRVVEGGRYEWVLGRWNGHNYSLGSVAQGEILERVWWSPLDRDDRDRKLELDRWYKMEVRVRGSSIECLVDGATVVKKDHDRYKDGRVGLRTFKTHARFRNLKVTDPTGKVLFEGLLELPAKVVDWIPDS